MEKEILTLRFPSAVIRSRLQVPQKCSDMDVMKLMRPRKPGILKAWDEEDKRGGRGDINGDGPLSASSHFLTSESSFHSPLQEDPFRRESPRPSDNRRLSHTNGP